MHSQNRLIALNAINQLRDDFRALSYRPPDDEWNGLNNAALANLSQVSLAAFVRYREELREDGHSWKGDAEEILTGFIWDESESARSLP